MKIKRQEKSNLVGRIRRIFMKEMMFDMREISGNVTGTNSTGRPVYMVDVENSHPSEQVSSPTLRGPSI